MDTQIGTRPQIGALEIHQAYILAILNGEKKPVMLSLIM